MENNSHKDLKNHWGKVALITGAITLAGALAWDSKGLEHHAKDLGNTIIQILTPNQ